MVRALTYRWDNLKLNLSDIGEAKIITNFILVTNPALLLQDGNNYLFLSLFGTRKNS